MSQLVVVCRPTAGLSSARFGRQFATYLHVLAMQQAEYTATVVRWLLVIAVSEDAHEPDGPKKLTKVLVPRSFRKHFILV